VDVQVDGGIGADNVDIALEAGANVIVAGSAVFKAEDRAEMIKKLKE
jgi:ribulose-phosphate 3-epimerase